MYYGLTSWGARFVCTQLSKDGFCKAGAIAHPAFMNESHVFNIEGKSPSAKDL